jgi:RES domain-containing protein
MRIRLNPERSKLIVRLQPLAESGCAGFQGELFRFINPRFSKAVEIVNGRGSLHAAGRWNSKGACRLSYTSLAPETALAEALAHVRYFHLPLGSALPRVLVSLRINIQRSLDLRSGPIRNALKLSQRTICSLDWRAENQRGEEAITQAWGHAFSDAGLEAVIVPSAAAPTGANVLVFPENLLPQSRFEVANEVEWPGR